MDKYDLTDASLHDSLPNTLMDTEGLAICHAVNEEEYETLRAREHESWMARKAEIICIRIKCNIHSTETPESCMQHIQELQNDDYALCEPYYDDGGYVYFERRIVL